MKQNKKLKILYFTDKPAPYRVKFFNLLNKKADLTVLFNYNKNDYRNPKWYKDNIYDFNYVYLKNSISFFGILKELKNEYDVIIIGTYASFNGAILNLLLKLKRKKYYMNADGGFAQEKESIISKLLKKTFISMPNYYLSSGEETNKYLTYYGAKEEQIFLYPFTSVEKKDILSKPLAYKEKIKLRKEKGFNYKRLFISVGSLIYRKGYDIFFEAIKNMELSDTGFIIIGSGEKKEEYQSFIATNKLNNVFLIDFCSKEDVFDYYKMSDVFFLPSREDIWGLVINEAMSCGLPIISSNRVISSIELLDKDSLYQYDSSEELKEKILKYVKKTEKELYNEGSDNLENISKYTIENSVEEHLKIFSKTK